MAQRFTDFLADNSGLDEATFLAKHPYPFLVSEGASSGNSSSNYGAEATTCKVTKPDGNTPAPQGGADATPWVIPVRRRDMTRPSSIVTLGRGDDCDLRIVHPLVSKKHAYFTHDPHGWVLADVQSTNGTYADGVRLEAHRPHRLNDSEPLRFGPAVKYRYFSAKAFFEYMSVRARMKDTRGFKRSDGTNASAGGSGAKKLSDSDTDVLNKALEALDN